jgi:hypothetical protein
MSEKTRVKNNNVHAAILQKRFVAKPIYRSAVMVDISITFPQVDMRENVRVAQRISTFYRESAKQYYDYASHVLFNQAVKEYIYSLGQHYPFKTYQVLQTFETPYNNASLLSIYYDRYEYTAGAHGNTTQFADTWQLSTGVRLKLSNFFDDSYYKSVIFDYITNDIKRQIDEGNTYYFDDYVKNVFRYFDESNYYLTDTGIAIFYPLYTITAFVQGIPTFIVPYETFDGSLKKRLFE